MALNPNLRNFFDSGFCQAFWPEDEAASRVQAKQACRLLGATEGHILDWRGGWGRHALPLAEMGFKVTLLDFCERYIKAAKKAFAEAGLDLTAIHADSRNTPPDVQADFAICMNNSVGFLEECAEVEAFTSLRLAMKPGARLLVDCANLFALAGLLKKGREESNGKGGVRRAHHDFDFVTNVNHSVFELVTPDGDSSKQEFHQTLYTPHGLARLLTAAGFTVDHVYGDLDGHPVSFDSLKIVMLAHT